MNMYPSKRPNNGWILCPSKSFPGKFYYFNVATGETAWCLNETERKSLKNSPLQRVDHGYPEPTSPPTEDTPTPNQQTIKFNPYERTISNYPQERSPNYQNMPKNPYTFVIPQFDQMPYQIQLPMICPSSSNMPQVIMIVMNQAMRQLSIEDPRQGFRQSNHALEPSQAWPEPNQHWKEVNQPWKGQNQFWKNLNQVMNEPNQSWKELNQAPVGSKEPDRELFIQKGKMPLCERFVNFTEMKNKNVVQTNQYDLIQNNMPTIKVPTTQNQLIDSRPSKSQNQHIFPQEPVLNFARENTQNLNPYLAISHDNIQSNSNVFMPTSQSNLSPKSYPNSENISKPNHGLFGQIQTNKIPFGQSKKNEGLFEQNQTKPSLSEQNQTFLEISQSSSFGKNLFQKLTMENLTLKPSNNVDLSNSPKSKEIPSFFEELNLSTNTMEKSTLAHDKKAESQDANLQNLDDNDLRRTLLEKKRKSNTSVTTKTKKIKTYMEEDTVMAIPKKKVTFNLVPEKFSDSRNDSTNKEMWFQEEVLPSSNNESWYVVTDAKTLLEDFDALNQFVKSDPACTLIIPSEVMTEIVALSRGESREASLVSLARHLLRALASPHTQINIQHSDYVSLDIWAVSAVDSILNCCLEVMDKTYVIIITSDENLQQNAEYLGITCLTSEQIKNGQAKQPEIHFDVQKVNSKENINIPTDEFENLSFGMENKHNQKVSSIDFENKYFNIRNRDKFETNFSKNDIDIENSIEKFEIQKGATNSNTTLKKHSDPRLSKFKNDKNQLETIFEGKTNEDQRKSVETETKNSETRRVFEKEINITHKKNESLEKFIKCFYEKNQMIENLVEERKDGIECNFKQIMEECLNDILQNKNTESPPPWTLFEALECMVKVYANHTYIRDIVAIFTDISNANRRTARYLIWVIGCGVALVQYLKFISPTTEILKDTEDALNMIFQNINKDVDIEMGVEPKAPALTSAELGYVEKAKRNFVKDRAEVLKYLKKHFPAWADYDECIEDASNYFWGKKYNDSHIVRTYGKNLGKLKLSNSKAMIMELSSQSFHENTNTSFGLEHAKQNENFENTNKSKPKTQHIDVDNEVLTENVAKTNFMDLKLTRTVKNMAAKVQNNFDYNQNFESTKDNTKSGSTEPKVIRSFNNTDITKVGTNINTEKYVFDYWSTPGHTFGTTEKNGPKIMKNIKPIKEYEEKFRLLHKSLELEDISSIVSKSDENNNFNSESTNNNCLSMSIEGINVSSQNKHFNAKNDVGRKNESAVKNDRFKTNYTQNLESNHNSTTTNNDSQPMSLENCITNNTYGTIDLDEILFIHCKPNDVFNSNLNTDIDDVKDDFKRLNRGSLGNDVLNDMMVVKDDVTNDSGYENASQQAYHLMDTFLFELKVTFKAMHMFLENSARALRGGASSAASRAIRHQASTSRDHLTKILEHLNGIIDRENSSGPKLKELVAGAGAAAAGDERVDLYREIVTKCYQHARLVDTALSRMVSIVARRKR